MDGKFVDGIITVLTAIVGIAVLAVLFSKQANTAGVITAASQGFGGILATAVSPIMGGGGYAPLVSNNASGGLNSMIGSSGGGGGGGGGGGTNWEGIATEAALAYFGL